MRNLGMLLIVIGVVGFFYCSSHLSEVEPLPDEMSISDSLHQPAGHYEVGRYVAGAAGAIGVLLAMFPKGR